jgi:hypothetical protein
MELTCQRMFPEGDVASTMRRRCYKAHVVHVRPSLCEKLGNFIMKTIHLPPQREYSNLLRYVSVERHFATVLLLWC